jgi:glycosyltransferase involved in cell wall biosynthesis
MTSADAIRFGALALQVGGGGVSTYSRELLKAIAPRLSATHEVSALVQSSAVIDLPKCVTPVAVRDNHGLKRALRAKLPCEKVSLFHSLDVDLPLAGPYATVATVHDLSVFDVPWAFSKVRAYAEQALVRDALHRADVIIAVSDFTAQRVMDLSGRESFVTPLAPASWARCPDPDSIEAVRSKYSLPANFVLQVGTVEPRKRPHLVAEVARQFDIPCVLAGQGSRSSYAPKSAIGLGYVGVDDLPSLYAAATVVAYASVYEGFSLPPVEAMACGAAVVASRVGALPDIVEDGAVLVPTHRLEDWKGALRPLIEDADARSELQAQAVKAASNLSWSRTADLTLKSYRLAGGST